MPLPVITDTYRAVCRWQCSAAPRVATNHMDFFDSAGGQTPTDLYNDLNANVTASMWELVSSTAAIFEVAITPLDGTSATQVFSTGTPAKWSGSGGSDPILQGCIVNTLGSDFRGPSKRGRLYLPFCGETGQAAGVLTPANVANMQTGWVAFHTAMLTAGWVPKIVSEKLNTSVSLREYAIRPFLKTQRRRARR